MSIDYEAEVARLVAELRTRDKDPAYADAPVLDSYARISRKASAAVEEKTTVQTWRNLLRIQSDGYRLGEVLVDEARSAWRLDGHRPAFNEVVARCASGASGGVVARFVDRLARQPWDMEQLIRVGEDRPYRIVTDADTYRFERWREIDQLRGEVKAARRDSQVKSEKVRDKVRVRHLSGDNSGGTPPFGHRWQDTDVPDDQLTAERKAIVWGYDAIIAGRSWGWVAKEWNARGLAPRRNTTWNALSVRMCLSLPRHAGLLTHKGEVVGHLRTGTAIVTRAVFDDFCRVLDGRRVGRQPGEGSHFLSNVLRCDACGRPMVGSRMAGTYDDGSPRRMYRCPPQGCGRVAVDARAAERWAGRQVVAVMSAPEHAQTVTRRGEELAELGRRIQLIQDAITQLDARTPGVHPDRVVQHQARIMAHEDELTPLLNQRDALYAERRAGATVMDVAALRHNWADATPAERRELCRLTMPNGFYVAPVGRGAWLRGDDILTRFSMVRGEARPRRLVGEVA